MTIFEKTGKFLLKFRRTWLCRHVWRNPVMLVIQDGRLRLIDRWPTIAAHSGHFTIVKCQKCCCRDLIDHEPTEDVQDVQEMLAKLARDSDIPKDYRP